MLFFIVFFFIWKEIFSFPLFTQSTPFHGIVALRTGQLVGTYQGHKILFFHSVWHNMKVLLTLCARHIFQHSRRFLACVALVSCAVPAKMTDGCITDEAQSKIPLSVCCRIVGKGRQEPTWVSLHHLSTKTHRINSILTTIETL